VGKRKVPGTVRGSSKRGDPLDGPENGEKKKNKTTRKMEREKTTLFKKRILQGEGRGDKAK